MKTPANTRKPPVRTALSFHVPCAALFLAAALAPAADYEFRPMTLANGGGTSAGGSYAFTHTLGPLTLGQASGGSYSMSLGYVPQAAGSIVLPLPDLSMTSSLMPLEVTENIPRNVTLTVSNRGPATATSVAFNAALPVGARATAATSSAGTCQIEGGSNVTCQVASLAGGASFSVQLTVLALPRPELAPEFETLGDLTASVASLQPDLHLSDNELTIPITVYLQLDWGDARAGFQVTRLENGARHRYWPGFLLGALWDAEGQGTHLLLANGDDGQQVDDEDGVVPASPFYRGLPTVVVVTSAFAGYLNAWADFNNDADWADAGEQILKDQPLVPGANAFTIYAPSAAALGSITTRWRASETAGLGPAGYGGKGEVEDHLIEVRAAPLAGELELHIARDLGGVVVTWSNPAALLEEAARVTGPFTTVPGASSPYAVPWSAAARKLYRLRLGSLPFEIPTTGQTNSYGNSALLAAAPDPGEPFHGQDAHYRRPPFQFTDNGDGTITDHTTGLMWQQAVGGPLAWDDAVADAAASTLAGYSDWRLPTVKELYSLIDFRGVFGTAAASSKPFIDTNFFEFFYVAGARFFDAQQWSSTEYVGTTMMGDPTVFGVNFADGRIKGYPKVDPGPPPATAQHYVRYVRGNPNYGQNQFVDLHDGTIFDAATGLMWQKADSGTTNNWRDALAYAEGLTLAGYDDWRLPTVKELQSIVDYTRAPTVAPNTAAINTSFFNVTATESFYWASTTVVDGAPGANFDKAGYLSFGQAFGYIPDGAGGYDHLDVHGAGAQRADFKSGDPASYPHGFGPQGDEIRIYNYVRCVRGGLR